MAFFKVENGVVEVTETVLVIGAANATDDAFFVSSDRVPQMSYGPHEDHVDVGIPSSVLVDQG